MRWAPAAAIFLLGLILLSRQPAPAAPEVSPADEQVLRDSKVGTENPALLEYLRKRTTRQADAAKLKTLVRQLGDDSFDVREEATQDLVRLGSVARQPLEEALKDPDVERARRAALCLSRISGAGSAAADAAAVRILAIRKPEGTAEVLMAFAASSLNPVVVEETYVALTSIALTEGKPDKVLLAGLTDKEPLKRAAAGVALCRSGSADALPAVRDLLKDGDAAVRFQVGLALVAAREKPALPVLIDLLAQLPRPQAWQVEDLLIRLAGEQRPAVPVGGDEAGRKRCRDAWADWWAKNNEKVKLEAPAKPLNQTLVVMLADGAETGDVREVDAQGKTLWEVKELRFPLDAQLVGQDHILCAEHMGKSACERDRKGKIVWEKSLPEGPLAAQRLANGNTFIVTETQLIEVDKDGKDVFTYTRPDGKHFAKAQKMPNGDIVAVIFNLVNQQRTDQEFIRLGPDRKDLLKFPLDTNTGGVRTNGGRIDVLANGNVLVPLMSDNKVAEYDTEGHILWEAKVDQPVAAVRLPNGNTLVTTFNQQRAIELDRAGRDVWEYKADVRVTRAWRR